MRTVSTCDRCKDRRLLCDGQHPQCGFCQSSNSACEMPQRGSRGPKKGYLKALRSRVVHLEGLLERRIEAQKLLHSAAEDNSQGDEGDSASPPPQAFPTSRPIIPHNSQGQVSESNGSVQETVSQIFIPIEPWPELTQFAEHSLSTTMHTEFDTGMNLRPNVQAELNQLYFDRVHPSIPLLHQRRFMSWARSSNRTRSCRCLQYAMWTLATLFSAQFRDLTEVLYLETKQMLDGLIAGYDRDSTGDTQLVQASVLIATCESIRARHQQAWMSAGRTFRLVQGMRFHEIDKPQNDGTILHNLDATETEERRRAFWMAYFLDHLFTMRNDWPITLNEHVICTRMPTSDEAFQTSQNALGPFLSEAMVDLTPTSPFNECLILATIWGRSLLRCQQYRISQAYGGPAFDWAAQDQWLDDILTKRLQVFSESYQALSTIDSPLPAFATILGHVTVVYNCKGAMETVCSTTNLAMSATDTTRLQIRASNAIASVIALLQLLSELHFSKVHPLMPLALFLCAEFLYNNKEGHESFRGRLKELVAVLRELQNVNDPDQSYLDLLPSSCVSATSEWLNSGINSNGNI